MDKHLDFTAIDFETANGNYNSICQIGLVRVEGGKVVHTINQLVQPPDNSYHWGNSRVHGLTWKDTKDAPFFHEVWHDMEPYITNKTVVAHNALFDTSCLKKTLSFYEMVVPPFNKVCTYKIYKSNLKALCLKYNIPLNHHDALSDAMACAKLFLNYLEHKHEFNIFNQDK